MIVIDNVLISDEIVEEHFVCDLSKCKGGCCEDGDAGAPLEDEELEKLEENYPHIKPYMTPEGIRQVELQGKFVNDESFGNVTPTINQQICAYGVRGEDGIIKCAIEKAYNDLKITWKKPVSCHMFPIKMQQSSLDDDIVYLNYEPRRDLCAPACKLGKSLKVRVFEFLKEPIIRKFGKDFYFQLQATANHLSLKSK